MDSPFLFRHRRLVEFADTDMAGIMHFSNYFRFMEVTEHAYFRALGLTLHWDGNDGSMGGFARVHADCHYRRPLVYLDEVETRLLVTRVGQRSLSYDVFFFPLGNLHPQAGSDDAPRVCTARGTMTVVSVHRDPGDASYRGVDLPTNVRERVRRAPDSLLDEYQQMFPTR